MSLRGIQVWQVLPGRFVFIEKMLLFSIIDLERSYRLDTVKIILLCLILLLVAEILFSLQKSIPIATLHSVLY